MSALLPTPDLLVAEPVDVRVEQFIVRPLTVDEGNAFRAIRLEALEKEGKYFATKYEDEVKLHDDYWRERCRETNEQCVLGLFNNDDLIGITLVSKWNEDKSGKTALIGSSYIQREYRGKGLGALLYSARLEWTKQKTEYEQSVVFHRDGNAPSKKLNERYGAVYWQTRQMQWAGKDDEGKTQAPGHWYRTQLRQKAVLQL